MIIRSVVLKSTLNVWHEFVVYVCDFELRISITNNDLQNFRSTFFWRLSKTSSMLWIETMRSVRSYKFAFILILVRYVVNFF